MKLTGREKILLAVLGFVAVIALSYFFMFKPQLEKLGNLAIDREKNRIEVERVKAEISPDNKIHKDYDDLYVKVEEKTVRFYPAILQDKIIVILDDLIKKTTIKADSASFSVAGIAAVPAPVPDPVIVYPMKDVVNEFKKMNGELEELQNNAEAASQTTASALAVAPAPAGLDQTENMSVTIAFNANYDQLMQFVKGLEQMNKTIVVKSLNITNGAGSVTVVDGSQTVVVANESDGQLSGQILVDFYALPKIHDQDEDYFSWPYNNTYGKVNPFN